MTHPTVAKLAQNRTKLLGVVSTLSEDELDRRLRDGWTIREMLTHLLNAEEDHCRISAVIARGESDRLPKTIDIDTYNAERLAARGRLDRSELLSALAAQRERTLALFNSLSESQLALSGPHPALGEMTVGNIFRVIAVHEQMHTRDIETALGRASPAPTILT
jgi:uncharacterized protein (TIGR03083 family)